MTGSALAAVLTQPRTFEYRSFGLPEIGDQDGLLEIEACGLCGTDYEQYRGHLGGVMGSRPIIPGHEVIGYVGAIGRAAARRWQVEEGDRVAVEPIIPCGVCRDCLTGHYTRCASDRGYGLYNTTEVTPSLWGGYATHLYLHPRAVIHRLPHEIPFDLMTLLNPLSNAIRWVSEVPTTEIGASVVIQGPGQRGLCAIVGAREAGASRVIVIGTARDRSRLDLALKLGADAVINADREDAVEMVAALTGGRMADVVLDAAGGSAVAVATAARLARRGGEVVLAGLNGRKPVEGLVTDEIVLKEIKLIGVLSSGYTAVRKAIEIIGSRKYPLELLCTHTFPLDQAEQAVIALGRETELEREPIHITLAAGAEVKSSSREETV